MYKQTGQEIRNYAYEITLRMVLPSVLLGIVVCFVLIAVGLYSMGIFAIILGILIAVLIIAPALWWARLFGSVLNGFGIIVEKMEMWTPDGATAAAGGAAAPTGGTPTASARTFAWTCPHCGGTNPVGIHRCGHCGKS